MPRTELSKSERKCDETGQPRTSKSGFSHKRGANFHGSHKPPKSHPNVSKKTLKWELNGAGGPKKTLKDQSKNKQHTYDPKVGKNEPKMNPQTPNPDPVSPQTPLQKGFAKNGKLRRSAFRHPSKIHL